MEPESIYDGEIAVSVFFLLGPLADYVMLQNKWKLKGFQLFPNILIFHSLYFYGTFGNKCFSVFIYSLQYLRLIPPTHHAFRSYFALLPNSLHYLIGFLTYHHRTYTLQKNLPYDVIISRYFLHCRGRQGLNQVCLWMRRILTEGIKWKHSGQVFES